MAVTIPFEQVKEITSELDMGMKCFYHIPSGQLKSYPDELKGNAGFEEEFWEEIIKEVEDAPKEYIAFEGMDSFESFRVIESFVADIPDDGIRQQFQTVISFKKPFQQFKYLLNDYPDLREHWFLYKEKRLTEWVQAQLEAYNFPSGE